MFPSFHKTCIVGIFLDGHTYCVSDQDILKHFRDVLAPYVIDHQIPLATESFLSPVSWSSHISGDKLVKEIENILLQVTDGEEQEKIVIVQPTILY